MKNIVLGITGGIAVYKVATLVRLLKKANINVDVIMTESATQFVAPLTFETLSNRPVTTGIFNRTHNWEVEHISLAKKADLFVVAPATANIIGKLANGIADDMLSTTLMATTAPILMCPAMNTNMYNSVACTANRQLLLSRGVTMIDSNVGELACGDSGKGRMAEPEDIFNMCIELLYPTRDLVGKNILVTVGGTEESLDDVRVITNHSSGKMGSSIITNCIDRGANVTAIVGKVSVDIDSRANIVNCNSTEQMHSCVMGNISGIDVAIMSAAPCDYRPVTVSDTKIKGDKLTIDFVKNVDIAKSVGQLSQRPKLVIFSAETDHGKDNAREKLISKNADFVVLNIVKGGAVFGSDDNTAILIDSNCMQEYPTMSKTELAKIIVDKVVEIL